MESWLSHAWFEVNYLLGMTAFTLGFSYRSEGRRNIPARGPALLIANHQSYLDPILVGLACRRPLCYLGRKTLFRHTLFRLFIQSLGAVPIDQQGVGKEGIKTVLEQLDLGRAVVVFPEGERTPHGDIQPLKPGIQLLVRRSRAPIVPVGIAGAYQALPRWRKYPLCAPLFLPAGQAAIAVSVGKPLDGQKISQLPREQALEEMLREIKKANDRAERLRRKA
jgi:1-acyl-sn-glycerol-3-phosphate acyltransferase